MAVTHIIYHIYGWKCGCTRNLENRIRDYRSMGYSREEIEVLEELHDVTDQEAGDRENYWNDRFGYKLGNHYAVTMTNRSKVSPKLWREMGIRKFEQGVGIHKLTSKEKAEAGRRGGKRTSELGKNPFQTMSHEEHVRAGRLGGSKTAARKRGG